MIYAFHAPLFGCFGYLLYMFYLKFKNANTILYNETQKKNTFRWWLAVFYLFFHNIEKFWNKNTLKKKYIMNTYYQF